MEKEKVITLIDAFKDFKEEKNIDRPVMMQVLKDVFLTQIAKTYGSSDNFDVIVNVDKGTCEIYQNFDVVEEVENPNAEITAIQRAYSAETAASFELERYDYILDAIDSLKEKSDLILRGTRTPAVFFSSMGAALKVNPQGVRVAEFWNVRGCPLGAAIRKKFKQNHTYPGHKFRCVYDEEVLPNRGQALAADASNSEWDGRKAQINGTTAHITALFGMTLAGLVIEDLYQKALQKN